MVKAPVSALLILGAFSLLVFSRANAVTLVLDWHKYNGECAWWCGGGPYSTINDGSHPGGYPASSVTWEWDGTVLRSTGFYSPVWPYHSSGGSDSTHTFFNDQIADLTIDTATATATATSYACVEGTYSIAGISMCGAIHYGDNFIYESTTIYGPGTAVSQTIGGDDVAGVGELLTGPYPRSISSYDYSLLSWDGTTLTIGNGIPLSTVRGQVMQFSVAPIPIPTAVWLFGSALGVMGWMRRKLAS